MFKGLLLELTIVQFSYSITRTSYIKNYFQFLYFSSELLRYLIENKTFTIVNCLSKHRFIGNFMHEKKPGQYVFFIRKDLKVN